MASSSYSWSTLFSNESVLITTATLPSSTTGVPILSRETYEILLTILGCITQIAGIAGIIANILIIITYNKIGINNSINTSYVAMACSDIACVVFTMWYALLLVPSFERATASLFEARGILYVTAGFPHLGFAKTTTWITAYIALERCLCVVFPHKVKLVFTKNFTVVVIVVIFIVCVIPVFLAFYVYPLVWKQSLIFSNKTILGITFRIGFSAYIINEILDISYGLAFTVIPLIITFLCTIFLAFHLRASSKWRNLSTQEVKHDEKPEPKQSKEDRIIKVVLFIAVASLVLSIPLMMNYIIIFVDPSQQPYTKMQPNLMDISASFATFLSMLNSTFNIIVYLKLGTKFRATLKAVLKVEFKM